MDAKPRMPTRQNLSRHKGRLLQARVRPGRHDVTDGSGGEDIKRKPGIRKPRPNKSEAAPGIKTPKPDSPGLTNPSRRYEARPNKKERRVGHGALQRFRMEPDRHYASDPQRRPTHQKATPQKPRAAPAPKMEGSETQQTNQQGIATGAANASGHDPDRNHPMSGPAANNPRNNATGCRQPDAITRKQIKTPSPKNTARHNGLRFCRGPSSSRNTHQDARTAERVQWMTRVASHERSSPDLEARQSRRKQALVSQLL